MIKKTILSIIIFLGLITFAQSENSWITKKDKTEKVKEVKKDNASDWIKKKKVKKKKKIKDNKKKLKDKIKDSKSWISKKSKDKVKDIQEKLKDHKTINQLPNAEFYFAAIIEPKENEEVQYVYGYVSSDKTSKKFTFKNNVYFSKSDGIAYFENKENSCEVDSQIGYVGDTMMGEVVLQCKKKLKMTGGFRNVGSVGKGDGETSNGNNVKFEFYTSKAEAIAKLENYKIKKSQKTFFAKETLEKNDNLDLKITGKYYALLIGNSKYEPEWSSLTSPVNDISEIGKILKTKYNFEDVLIVKDANRNEMFEAFEKLSEMTTDVDYVLIYYAGHGDIKGNKSYWIPVDAQKNSIRNWINLSDIENYLIDIPAHHLAVMVDSCYFSVSKGSNEIKKKQKNMLYQKLIKKRARIVLASGQNEPVDDTGAGKHSVFGKSFIDSLKNNKVISLREIGNDIAYAHAGMRQQPYVHLMYVWGHNNGDFVFVSKK